MTTRTYKDLQVWQKSMGLVKALYELVESFPDKERYRLTDQICRAAVSIPSNLSEGSARLSTKEFIRFIRIALGSSAELETQIELAYLLGYISEEKKNEIIFKVVGVGKMLTRLEQSMQHKLNHPKQLATSY